MDVQAASDGSKKRIAVWQSFRGNEWDDKGEQLGEGEGSVSIAVSPVVQKNFYEERKGCEQQALALEKLWHLLTIDQSRR